MIATRTDHPLVSTGDLRLGNAFHDGTYKEPLVGQYLGQAFLPETGHKLIRCNVYLIGVLQGGQTTQVVGVCPGRQEVFLGEWWSSPGGAKLWLWEGIHLGEQWPTGAATNWRKDVAMLARAQAVCDELVALHEIGRAHV